MKDRIKSKKYYEKNKDKIKEKRKIYDENNKEILKEKNKKYYENKKEILLEKRQNYRKQKNKRYTCDFCNFKHYDKTCYNKHCKTSKHLCRIIPNDVIEIFF